MNTRKPHLSAPVAELSSKIAAVRNIGKQLESALADVDAEIKALRDEINLVSTAPVSRAEFCEYAMRNIREQASTWQDAADASMKRYAIAPLMVSMTRPSSIDGAGELSFSRSKSEPICPLAPSKYNGMDTDLAYTAWDPRTVTPAVAWMAILGEPFEQAIRTWIMSRAEAIGLPERASIPLEDRPERMDVLISRLRELLSERKALVEEIGSLTFSLSDRVPSLPTDTVPVLRDEDRRDGIPYKEAKPVVYEIAPDGKRVPVGAERWLMSDEPSAVPGGFDAWLENEVAENAAAAKLAAEGGL